MEIPKLYVVFYINKKDESKHFKTNCENVALKKQVRTNGQTYIDTRYLAKLRLYNYYLNQIRIK